MVDEEQPSLEEEYQISEGADTSEAFGVESPEMGKGRSAVSRRIFISIGVIVVVLVVYKLSGLFWGAKKAKRKVVTPTVVTQPVVKTVPVKKITAPQITTEQMQVLRQRISVIANQGQTNASVMAGLQQQIKAMREDLNMMTQQLAGLKTNITTLNKRLTPKKPPVVVKKRLRKRRIQPPMQYYVQAAIPGRAWLKSEKGTTITVGIGSKLYGYGTIRKIDPSTGVVETSSGRIMKYNPDDI